MTARGMLVIHMIQAKDGKVTCMALLEVLIVLAHCKQHRGEANTVKLAPPDSRPHA